MRAKLTAETITDEQIRELFVIRPDAYHLFHDKVNLHETVEPYASLRRDARARCAEILNARSEGGAS